jgi:hypothetical protein
MMRIVSILLCAFMVLFAAVQYNDPDGPYWAVAYLIPALWAGLAGFRPDWMQSYIAKAGLLVTLLAYLVATAYFWPTEAGWWRIDVWWDSETAREGMGLMIASAVIAVAGLTLMRRRGQAAAAGRRA